ncbi:MAG: nucleoside deaminase [Gelidibacter sp.]
MEKYSTDLTLKDYEHLKECLALAREALLAGDSPFGSILVNGNNEIIARARNKVNTVNILSHPEIELAHWAIVNLSTEERAQTTMYTSGEHCPMCAGAQAWVGIGQLVFLSSAQQLVEWLKEFGVKDSPIHFVPSREIIKGCVIKGPGKGQLLEAIKALHKINNS